MPGRPILVDLGVSVVNDPEEWLRVEKTSQDAGARFFRKAPLLPDDTTMQTSSFSTREFYRFRYLDSNYQSNRQDAANQVNLPN